MGRGRDGHNIQFTEVCRNGEPGDNTEIHNTQHTIGLSLLQFF